VAMREPTDLSLNRYKEIEQEQIARYRSRTAAWALTKRMRSGSVIGRNVHETHPGSHLP
jgi:hypothetical protein